MKKYTFLFLTLTFMGSTINAQTIKVKEPDFIGSVILVNDTIGEGLPMTFQEGVLNLKSALFKTGFYYIEGCCSPFTINQQPNVYFIATFSNNSTELAQLIAINKLKQDKDKRIIGEFKNDQSMEQIMPFTSKKYGVKSYLIEIHSPEKGEYAIAINRFYYSFSIK